jgi:hypothetical protein
MALMEAKVFGNLETGDHGLRSAATGLGARGGLENEFGSFLIREAFDYQEGDEECEN